MASRWKQDRPMSRAAFEARFPDEAAWPATSPPCAARARVPRCGDDSELATEASPGELVLSPGLSETSGESQVSDVLAATCPCRHGAWAPRRPLERHLEPAWSARARSYQSAFCCTSCCHVAPRRLLRTWSKSCGHAAVAHQDAHRRARPQPARQDRIGAARTIPRASSSPHPADTRSGISPRATAFMPSSPRPRRRARG